MNYKAMARITSMVLLIESVLMCVPLFISIYDAERGAVTGFMCSMLIGLGLSCLLMFFGKGADRRFYAREGFVVVGVAWIVMSLIGSLPFFISREIPSYIDCLFETVSGFTTTGASVLSDVESLSRGMLYWRSFTHWLGGMGMLVFLIAIVPQSGKAGGFSVHILRAESSGPAVGKLVPKMRNTALILYLCYIMLTVLDTLFLYIGTHSLFDSLCLAYGTAGTGGFGILNDGFMSYSPYVQYVTTVFMILFGVNFTMYYYILLRKFAQVIKDEEIRVYFGVIIVATALITMNVRPLYSSLSETIRHAVFQVGSIITTTGFATTDTDLWPTLSKSIIFMLMFCGACAGSTGGGFKLIRIIVLAKEVRRNTHKLIHPNEVRVIRYSGSVVDEQRVANINAYLAVYVFIIALSFLLLSHENFSLMTNLSAVVSAVNNIGPGFEGVGATCNFAAYSGFSKVVLSLDMLIGRLEIFPILSLFSLSTWKVA